MNEVKKCSKCGIDKNIKNFPKIGNKCKDCIIAYQKSYKQRDYVKEAARQYQRGIYKKNTEGIREKVEKYRLQNKEKINKKVREKYKIDISFRKMHIKAATLSAKKRKESDPGFVLKIKEYMKFYKRKRKHF